MPGQTRGVSKGSTDLSHLVRSLLRATCTYFPCILRCEVWLVLKDSGLYGMVHLPYDVTVTESLITQVYGVAPLSKKINFPATMAIGLGALVGAQVARAPIFSVTKLWGEWGSYAETFLSKAFGARVSRFEEIKDIGKSPGVN